MAGTASGQRTVLLISDDMSDRAAIKSSLEKNNVSVLISENWQQCLPSVPYINPDLILLNVIDKNLSQEDRFGICRKLKEQKETKDIPLIVVVGSREGGAILEAGAEDFIVSPVQSEELAARVRVYLENHYLKKLLEDGRTGDRVHRAGVLLSDMSHDIRTRLNAIIGFTELLEQDRSLTADHREKLDTIHRNGTHLSLLIDDLVEICRLETGRSTLNMTSFGLDAFIRDIEKVSGQKNNGLQCDARTDATGNAIGVIVADRERLMRAIMNLIDHSVKAGRNSVVGLQLYTVRDTGGFKLIGEIYPGREDRSGELTHSSQASKRTPERTAVAGTRHGLVLGRELVRCLGGTVEVMSDSEGRDRIHFELIVREGSIRPTETGISYRSLMESGNPEAKRVLVADDAEENCIVFTAILEHLGFEVRSVENGEEAVRQYDKWNPHIIMMDLRMPGMDGYEAARMIRTRQGGADALIFAATGDATDSDREKIRESGMDGFILKPYDEDTVRKKIEEFVRIRAASLRKDGDSKPAHAPCENMAISQLPHGIVDKMQEAARNARLDILLQIVDETGAYNAGLAGRLRELIKRYDYESIFEILGVKQ
jgi:two-component system, sensor histidine kinase and response regulator